jgi:alkanesulfonate monooxygenase SsuD/methylene tetrahydromethanopterin reductase-like flavin-dependent oxidoreductase (luciferase family)
MLRDAHCNVDQLKDLSDRLEDSGYNSVLLTFHSAQADYFIKSAAALTPGHKLKYMLALRPYHVSPQYAAMMTRAYSEIDKDRLVFNWVAGDFHGRDDEPDIEFDIFGESEAIDSIQKRTTFLRKFIDMYRLYCPTAVVPRMVFSGASDYAIETTRMFKGTTLCMLDTYRENPEKFDGVAGRMVSAGVVILESSKDIEEYKEKLRHANPRLLSYSIIGDRETVKQKINELENEKITDLLLFTNNLFFGSDWSKQNDIAVNKLVKEINSEAKQHDN